MAKIKGTYVTNLSGRVGNVVYRNVGGDNIASTRPASVYNPKTLSQMINRVAFYNAVQAESILLPIVNHSEGLTRKTPNLSYFMRENVRIIKENLDTTSNVLLTKGGKGVPYFNFLVSSGSLTPLDSNMVEDTDNHIYLITAQNTGNINPTANSLSLFFDAETTYTFAWIYNNVQGLASESDPRVSYYETALNTEVKILQFKFDEDFLSTTLSNANSSRFSDGGVTVLRYFGSLDDFYFRLFTYNGETYLAVMNETCTSGELQIMGGVCWKSIKYSDSWDFSTQYLSWSTGQIGHFDLNTLNACLYSFGTSETYILKSPSVNIGGTDYIWSDNDLRTSVISSSFAPYL